MPLKIHTDPAPLRIDLGDQVRIGKTRVTLQTVLYEFQNGACPEEIVHSYPTLRLADVYATIAYYLNHRTEVDEYLQEVHDEEDRLLAEAGAREDQEGFWKRLKERQRKLARPE
jgi:uncharacterized protein (DUF433 family)